MNLPTIKQIIKSELSTRRSSPYNEIGDKYAHGERTAALALKLRQQILPNNAAHDNILTVAAWFHDICNGQPDHCQQGAIRTRQLQTSHMTAE